MTLPRPSAAVLVAASSAVFAACGGDPDAEYRFTGVVTACETASWAEERHRILEEGDTAEAGRFASSRCFRVEPQRRVRVVDREGGAPWSAGRWVEVESLDGSALEHLASAELRRAMGLPVRTTGWVRGEALQSIE